MADSWELVDSMADDVMVPEPTVVCVLDGTRLPSDELADAVRL